MEITTKLITVDYIKSNTVVQQLVEDFELDHYITFSQEHHIRPILGDTLYNTVINEVNANSGSTSGLTSITIQNLVNQIQLPLAYYTVTEAIPYMSVKFASNGILERTGSNFTPVDLDKLKYIKSDFHIKAKSYALTLTKFLEDNKTDYYDTSNEPNKIAKRSLGGFYF